MLSIFRTNDAHTIANFSIASCRRLHMSEMGKLKEKKRRKRFAANHHPVYLMKHFFREQLAIKSDIPHVRWTVETSNTIG